MWEQLLSGIRAEQARARALQIADSLPAIGETDSPWELAQSALVYATLTEERVADRRDWARACMEAATERLSEGVMSPRLFGGFTGVGWAMERVRSTLYDSGDEDPCVQIDEAVMSAIERPMHRAMGYTDLISGLVGIGVYALTRLPRPSAQQAITRIVKLLEDAAECHGDEFAWWTYSTTSETHGRWGYNFGMAHGIAGILAFLSSTLSTGLAQARVSRLLHGAVRWLLRRQLKGGQSRFPAIQGKNDPALPTRAAWCYGDPGIAIALAAAASVTQSPEIRSAALQVARGAARRERGTSGVVDGSVCHGSSGLAHLFNRLYNYYGDPLLAESARAWIEHAQADTGWQVPLPVSDRRDILTGVSGMALVLVAAASNREPRWDDLLLARLPRSSGS
ncbi:MAG: lanthionine synthetase C family protein [Polyangiaceae bacterium]